MSFRLKAISLVVIVLVAVVASYVTYSRLVVNPRVITELQTNPQGQRAGIAMLITFADGQQIPVNYLREGNTIFAGADGGWWRQFQGDGAPVTLLVRGQTLTGHATVVLDDPAYTHSVFKRLRPKAPAWLPDWLNGKLIVIGIDKESGS